MLKGRFESPQHSKLDDSLLLHLARATIEHSNSGVTPQTTGNQICLRDRWVENLLPGGQTNTYCCRRLASNSGCTCCTGCPRWCLDRSSAPSCDRRCWVRRGGRRWDEGSYTQRSYCWTTPPVSRLVHSSPTSRIPGLRNLRTHNTCYDVRSSLLVGKYLSQKQRKTKHNIHNFLQNRYGLYTRYQSGAIVQVKNTANDNQDLIWPHSLLTRLLQTSPLWKEVQNANSKNPASPYKSFIPPSIKYLNQPHTK